MNKTLETIYEEYRDEMKATLKLEELVPYKFYEKEFVARFWQRVELLDTLIALYRDLLIARTNRADS